MNHRYIHILAAFFLIVALAVQLVVSYRQARLHVQERIDLKTQIAHENILFELYDAYKAVDQMEDLVMENLTQPDELLKGTYPMLKRYPHFFNCYAAFPEYYYPEKGKWYCPCSYRVQDSILTVEYGDENHDYFAREWYKGALQSGDKGYWSKPYRDEDFAVPIVTHSVNVMDKNGDLICVVGIDLSLPWIQRLLEQFKPIDEAVCMLYSSDGTVFTTSDNLKGHDPNLLTKDMWIISRQTLNPVDIDMVIAVPRWLIWKEIGVGVLFPFVIFVLGTVLVGVFVRRMLRDQQEKARLETEKQLMSHELQIAHGIQMGILRNDFPQDDDIVVHADLLPMHEVGGDLYDFSRLGDYLWFIVGDVSGKGVSAAMFMSAAVNLFRSALGHQTSPQSVIEEMNAVLSENNPSLTFVTAFVGRLHISSGQIVYCNAAHLPPLVQNKDLSVRSIKIVPNIPLGYDGKFQFVEEACMLGEGEALVLYTDGVTEARNAMRKMMGKQQWMKAVAHGDDLLAAVKDYIGEAEPTDDITLMTIRKKSTVQPVTLHVPNHKDQWPLLRRTLHEYGMCIGMERRELKKLEVALEEAVVNVMDYSHATEIEFTVVGQCPTVTMTLTDDGVAFDPTNCESDTSKAIDERQIGGLGISLLRQIADELHYQRTNEKNQLTITKYL